MDRKTLQTWLSGLLIFFAVLGSGFANPAFGETYDLAADFSLTNNPNGVWSYGLSERQGGEFHLITEPFTMCWSDCINCLRGWLWTSGYGAIFSVEKDSYCSTIFMPADTVAFHPGPQNQPSIIRWTAPSPGTYLIEGSFRGRDFANPTTTNVAILHGSAELFSAYIESYNNPTPFSITRCLIAGENIDFTVGYGRNGNYFGDSTGIDARITRTGESCAGEPGTKPIDVLHVSIFNRNELQEIINSVGASGFFNVTQVSLSEFNSGKPADINRYDVIVFGLNDCYEPSNYGVQRTAELRAFVENGGGIVWTHDAMELKFDLGPDVEIPAGVDDVGASWVSSGTVEIVKNHDVLHYPFEAAKQGDVFSVQYTHSTGGIVTTADLIARFYGGGSGANNFYLTVHEWGKGRVAVNQLGHVVLSCGGGYVNIPAAREAQLFVNSLCWAGRCGAYANQPPVAEAGPAQTIECAGPAGAVAGLDGSGSSDPDGDTLTYAWTWSGGSAAGINPTITLPLGTHTITLTVDDGKGGTATDTVTITVRDTTPPVTTVRSISGVAGNNSWYTSDVTITVDSTDTCSGVKEIQYSVDGAAATASGSTATITVKGDGIHDVTFGAADNAGNPEQPRTLQINIDKTPPAGNVSLSPGLLWPPNHKMVNVAVNGGSVDAASGVASVVFTVADEYGTVQPAVSGFNTTIPLEAWREGADMDGRHYTVTAVITDKAGNSTTVSTEAVCPHDMKNK